jgi:hypothetical protein
MKTTTLLSATLLAAALAGTGAVHAVEAGTMPPAAAAMKEPDPATLAQMERIASEGRFGAAFKRALKNAPAGPIRDRVLALDDEIVEGVFARVAARRLTVADARAVSAFYASPAGQALTAAQLADGPAPLAPEHREAIAAFFATPAGRRFDALLADPGLRGELQLALAFIAGPAADA